MSQNITNKFIRFEYKDKPLPLIDDYQNDGSLSLEIVLEPVLSQVDQLDQSIKKAKQLCHYPSEHGLTEDESAAVYLYTDDSDGQGLYCALNQALQSEDPTVLKPWLGFLKLFKNALEKLPTVKDTIWRGLPNDSVKQLEDHEEIVCWGITSCSTSADIIRNILDQNSILCSIKPLNAKNVHDYTPFTGDDEVLLLPGTHLRVKSKELSNRDQKSVINLEEISDVIDEEISPNDVTMKFTEESANEEDIADNDHLKMKSTTLTNAMNNGSSKDDENLKKNEVKAEITFSKGERYKVTYKNGKKQGYGRYYGIDGENVLEDEDADNKANGEGICAFKNGDYFIGTFERGVRHGHGILCTVDGSIQAGEWFNDDLINPSLKILPNQSHYQWIDAEGKEHWYGVYLDDNGNKYIGNVVDGKAEGLGIRIWSDKSCYEGNFENDKKNGYGIYRFANSARYKGHWTDDEINGNGKFIWNSGTKYQGHFINGKRHGLGTLTFSNGKIQDGNWHNDVYVQ